MKQTSERAHDTSSQPVNAPRYQRHVISIVIFGVLHAYQGIAGIVGTMLIGAVFMALYLVSQNILVPIVVHALFDLRSLVLIPMVIHKVHWDRN